MNDSSDDSPRSPDSAKPSPEDSVVHSIEARCGEASRVLLPDSAKEDSPMLATGTGQEGTLRVRRGAYQVLGEMARGGVGVILKSHDKDLGRDVAMKMLRDEFNDDPVLLQRFVEEAQISGQLQHPGIPPIYEMGLRPDERPYFTMKLIKGRTLAAQLDDRAEPQESRHHFLRIFEQICQTMAYAHSRGVIHRDLKPANVMVGAFGEVQVMDWGFAKVLARGGVDDEKRALARESVRSIIQTVRSGPGSSSHSMAGSVMGTPAYMPPEQARGEIEKTDERSDVFSLGAVLCEILTGRSPYGREEDPIAAAAECRLDATLERLESSGAEAELQQLCKSCLAPAPVARPRNAEVVAKRIQDYLGSVDERARQAEVRAARARGRQRLALALLCFIVLAALGGGGGYLWLQEQEAQHRQTLEETIARALTEASTAFGLAKGEKSGDLTHWEEALEALRRVKSMIEGPGTSEATRTRVATLAAEIESGKQEAIARFAEEERLQEFLATLEEIRFGAGHRSSEPYGAWANDQYSKVFAGYGLDLNSMSVDQACREIAEHPAAFELSQALDEWSVVARQAVRANWGELIEIAQAADPDEDRNVVRDAVLAEDDQALLQLGRDSDLQHLPAATLFLLGTSLLNAGLSEDALALMRYAHRRFPSNVALVHSLAQIISRGRRSGEEALRYAYGVVGLRPSAKSWTLVLTLLDQQDHAVAAHELALEMLEQYPTDPDTLLAVGRVLAFQGVPDPSLLALKKLRHLGEQSSMSLFLEGVCHTMNNDLEAARAKYQASLQEPEIEEAHLRSHIGLGRLALNEGDWQGARREFEASSSIQGTYAQGLLSYQEGDLQGAEIDLIGSLRTANDRVDPTRANFPPILQDMVRWLTTCPIERLRDSAKALTTAERLLEIKKNADAWSQLGAARFRCQDYQGADRAFQRAAVVRGVHHADPAPLFFRAMTQWHLGERENARESYRKALLALQSKTPVFQSLERLVALPLKEEAAALLEIEE